MLQAQIDIIDEAGHTEDSVTILGRGQVSLGFRNGSYLHSDEAQPDLAVISHDGARVLVQVKAANMLRRDNQLLAIGSVPVTTAPAFVVFIAALRRYVREANPC